MANKFNIKDQLAGIAALIAAIVAIGGGFVKYGEVMTKIDVLENASKSIDIDYSADIAVLEEKVSALESVDTKHGHTKILVNEKQIELLQVQIDEIKIRSKHPLE